VTLFIPDTEEIFSMKPMQSVQKALACTNLHGKDSLIHAQCLCPEGSLKKLERVQVLNGWSPIKSRVLLQIITNEI
jgi:hypothetical protein